ncbi:MAG: hypothetical protein E7166_02795 [Firmicutes bacterium]|nr:hypothetical protein [Bacillota bacterium]
MFDISKLLSNIEKTIKIDEQIIFEDNYLQNTDIIEISPVSINGEISKNDIGDLELSIYVTGELVLPCSITLEPVKYPFSFEINEIIDENDENNLKKDTNTLELKPYLWENILVEIPLRIVSENAYKKEYKGEGWQLINGEEKKENKNNPFEALNQLLDKE